MLFGLQPSCNIFLVDEHRSHLEEIQHEFHDPSKYRIRHYSSDAKFLKAMEENKPHRGSINILILGSSSNGDQEKKMHDIRAMVKTVADLPCDIETVVLLPVVEQKTENDLLSLGVYAVIQNNENAFMRITNHMRGIVSRKMFEKEKRFTRITLTVFFLFVLAVLVAALITLMVVPEFFSLR